MGKLEFDLNPMIKCYNHHAFACGILQGHECSKNAKVNYINQLIESGESMQLVRQDAKEQYIISLLEMILAQNEIISQFSEQNIITIGDAIVEKLRQKKNSECFEYQASNYFASVAGYNNEVMEYVLEETATIIKNVMAPYKLQISQFVSTAPKTRGGYLVRFSYAPVLSERPTESEISTYLSGYIDCTLIEIQERGFNCFAYAFFSLDSRNSNHRRDAILTDISPFNLDTSYKELERTGAVAYYTTHAGIIQNPSYKYFIHGVPKTEYLLASLWNEMNIVVSHPASQRESTSGSVVKLYK